VINTGIAYDQAKQRLGLFENGPTSAAKRLRSDSSIEPEVSTARAMRPVRAALLTRLGAVMIGTRAAPFQATAARAEAA
jgi:hypothetical protein